MEQKKIDKRDRKLVDYDGQRHSFQTLQASKKREEAKVARAKEQLEEAKRTFAVFNAELNEEMPALYDSRVLFYLTNLQTLFSAEQVFHSELSKVCQLQSSWLRSPSSLKILKHPPYNVSTTTTTTTTTTIISN